jgi:hypothetical protein
MKLGYLDSKDYEKLRIKRVLCLEGVITDNLRWTNFIIKTARRNNLHDKLNFHINESKYYL